jgi:hypothetical protein
MRGPLSATRSEAARSEAARSRAARSFVCGCLPVMLDWPHRMRLARLSAWLFAAEMRVAVGCIRRAIALQWNVILVEGKW